MNADYAYWQCRECGTVPARSDPENHPKHPKCPRCNGDTLQAYHGGMFKAAWVLLDALGVFQSVNEDAKGSMKRLELGHKVAKYEENETRDIIKATCSDGSEYTIALERVL